MVLQHCRSNDNKRCFIYDQELGSVSECGIQEADIIEEFLENRISFRLQANIPLVIGKDYKVCFPQLFFSYFLKWEIFWVSWSRIKNNLVESTQLMKKLSKKGVIVVIGVLHTCRWSVTCFVRKISVTSCVEKIILLDAQSHASFKASHAI